jgi:uridine kinase
MIRDVETRGRTPRSVLAQFFTNVRPMHELHVAPQKALADIVVVCPFDAGPAHADASAELIAERLG